MLKGKRGGVMLGMALVPLAAACAPGMRAGTLSPTAAADVQAHAMVSAVDAGEIQQAQLAVDRAQNGNVRGFAQRMITEHSNALQLRDSRLSAMGRGLRTGTLALANMEGANVGSASVTADVSTLNGVNGGTGTGSARADAFTSASVLTDGGMTDLNAVLMANPASRPMAEMAMRDLQQLGQLSGAAFDRAYMDKQVMAHQNALTSLDNLLAQNTLSAELKAILATQRGAVAMHLQMAQQLRAQL